jgi:ABC-type bacteriocin/lantibiotic exporter with double-glycine peptidase domain
MGVTRSEKQVAKLVGTNKVSGESPKSLERAARKFSKEIISKDCSNWLELMRFSKTHHILIGYWLRTDDTGHYSVVEKVTPTSITIYDPWDDKPIRYKRSYFDTVWCRGFVLTLGEASFLV